MRIVLIRPVYRTATFDPEVQEPLGLEYLAAFLRSAGHTTLLLDPILSGQSEEVTARRTVSFMPDVVGLSMMTSGDIPSGRLLVERIRQLSPEWPPRFVVGGNLITTEPNAVYDALPVDAAYVQGEGEWTCRSLLESWRGAPEGETPSAPRIIPAAPVSDLDALPFPSREFVGSLRNQGFAANIEGSRGCTGHCAYCCMPGLGEGGRWRARSPESIAEEMALLARTWGIAVFNFVDSDFVGPAASALGRASDLAAAVTARGLRVTFGIQAIPAALTEGVVSALRGAGLSYAFLGVENDDERVLARWNRRQRRADPWDTVRILRRYGVEVQVGCILFHPDATLSAIQRLAQTLSRNAQLNYRTATSRLRLLPGSRLYAHADAQGAIPEGHRGPFTPPCHYVSVTMLYEALIAALAPLRACWLHAAALFPRVSASAQCGPGADGPAERRIGALRNTIAMLDSAVTRTFFTLCEKALRGDSCQDETAPLATANLAVAESAAHQLAEAGMVASYETLRDIIRLDCRLEEPA